jgi:gluconokinase
MTIESNMFQRSRGAVVSCSAAKPRYRDVLREAGLRQPFVHLAGSVEVVAGRGADGPATLCPPVSWSRSSLEPLQDDEIGVTLSLDLSV